MSEKRGRKQMMSIRVPVDLLGALHTEAVRTHMTVTEIMVRAVRVFLCGSSDLKDGDVRVLRHRQQEGGDQ